MFSFVLGVFSIVYFYNECASICKCKTEANWKYHCPISNNWRSDGFLRCEGFRGPVYFPTYICHDEYMFVEEYATDNVKEHYKIYCCEPNTTSTL